MVFADFSWLKIHEKKWLDGVFFYNISILQIISDFLMMKTSEIPISLRKHFLKSKSLIEFNLKTNQILDKKCNKMA